MMSPHDVADDAADDHVLSFVDEAPIMRPFLGSALILPGICGRLCNCGDPMLASGANMRVGHDSSRTALCR